MQRIKQFYDIASRTMKPRPFIRKTIRSARKIDATAGSAFGFDKVNQFFKAMDQTTEDRNYTTADDLLTKKDGELVCISARILGPGYAPLATGTPAVVTAYNELIMKSVLVVIAGGDVIHEEPLSNLMPVIDFAGEYSRPMRSMSNPDAAPVIDFRAGDFSLILPTNVGLYVEHRLLMGTTFDYTPLADHRFVIDASFYELKQGSEQASA